MARRSGIMDSVVIARKPHTRYQAVLFDTRYEAG
ncbi:unnamed protein product [Acanthoscelides obtectus]|uniref:Uncharacterized protein n=1 Tax=Acanthoscelides obtectus TaxID=200917 RepID=A0A9P0K4B6_ACAOB|nr:unnamed protein product [Acanthoscelides obtectus]CAK1623484.1 hypothetical protein AOBTE_LOCUS2028 [Acanthoscelides obtectus]